MTQLQLAQADRAARARRAEHAKTHALAAEHYESTMTRTGSAILQPRWMAEFESRKAYLCR